MSDTAYMVLKAVGQHFPGEVISFSRPQTAAGVDVARLIALGAIRAATSGEIAHGVTPANIPIGANTAQAAPGMFTGNSAPVSGTSGSYAGIAGLGSIYIDVSATPPAFYSNTGTLGSPTWTAASGGGSITDATTSAIGGVEVDHARSGAHSVALTTDGLALPSGMIGTTSSTACAGDDARLSDARHPLGSLVTVTDNYTVLTTDHTILVAASGKTITLPDPSTVPADTEFRIGNTAAGDTTTVATAAGTILGAATHSLGAAKASAIYVSDAVSDYSVF